MHMIQVISYGVTDKPANKSITRTLQFFNCFHTVSLLVLQLFKCIKEHHVTLCAALRCSSVCF